MPDSLTPRSTHNSSLRYSGKTLTLFLLPFFLLASADAQRMFASAAQPAALPSSLPEAPALPEAPSLPSTAVATLPASIGGVAVDLNGTPVSDATVTLTHESSHVSPLTVITDADGRFDIEGASSGKVILTIKAPGMEPWIWSGSLQTNTAVILPQILLRVSSASADVEVRASVSEVAAAQVSLEEKQRVLGVFPNFYAVYVPNAAPLTSKQKFSMAWKQMSDPVTFGMVGFIAGVQQAQNDLGGYGQGTQGFAKRLGAGYGDAMVSTMLGQAILPSLLHQDPRYFVKGTGSRRSRTLYAIATTVMCKSDRGHWQPNYSNVVGNLAAAGISNAYYPASSRHGASSTIENSLLGTAAGAFGNLMQEFMLRHMTPDVPNYNAEPAKQN